MTARSLPDALATIARLDGVMRPAAEAATQGPWFTTDRPWFRSEDGVLAGSPDGNVGFLIADCDDFAAPRDEYEGPLKLASAESDARHIAATCPANVLAYTDAVAVLAKHAKAETKRAETADRELDEAREQVARLIAALKSAERRICVHCGRHELAGDAREGDHA